MERQILKDKLIHLFTNSTNDITIYFEIDIIKIICADPSQANTFTSNPSLYLQELLSFLQRSLILDSLANKDLSQQKKIQIARRLQNTHVMFSCIPFTRKIYKQFSEINSSDVGKWIVLTGTIIQSSNKKTLDKSKIFTCKRCAEPYRIRTTYENSYKFQVPPQCTKLVEKKKSDNYFSKFFKKSKKSKDDDKQKNQSKTVLQKCGSSQFQPVEKGKICVDYQQLKMQEQFQYISTGKIPQTILVIIQGDFDQLGPFRAGDDLTITGFLGYQYSKLKKQHQVSPQLILYANHIVVQKTQKTLSNDQFSEIESIIYSESQFEKKNYGSFSFYDENKLSQKDMAIVKQLQFRKQIINNFCPGIYGRSIVKLGLLLAFLGGVSLDNQNTKIRGNSHVLLVGEPGTGKSVLLKEISKIAQRSFFTNAIGTTSAGLSVSHHKEGSDWTIEAGALALADNGICCIDELTLLSKTDEKSLLESMEQQTISSAKASVMSKLNARTTVICACNPIRPGQKYDEDLELEANTGLSIPLLTRFDMIFIMKDEHDIGQDGQKCDHFLSNFLNQNDGFVYPSKKHEPEKLNLRNLLKECKEFSPELSNHEIFSTYFTEERKRNSKVKTARTFEALCRIAEAHAKLMLRDETSQLDCLTAIMITENVYISSLQQYYMYLDQFNKKYGTDLS